MSLAPSPAIITVETMSRAIVKDGDGDAAATGPEERPKGPRYVTPDGFKQIQAELERLWKVERRRVTAEVATAAAMGDRSENAEYIYGKKRLREIDRRIHHLSRRLDSLTVVDPTRTRRDRVFFGAWVTVEGDDGEETTYRIVGPDEFDVARGRISVESPLARALLGKRKGDEVVVQRPRGRAELTIVRVRYDEGPVD